MTISKCIVAGCQSGRSSGNLIIEGDIILDDGGSIKEAGGTAAITIDASGEVTKIGQGAPSDGQVLTWDNSNSKVVWSTVSGGGGGNRGGGGVGGGVGAGWARAQNLRQ